MSDIIAKLTRVNMEARAGGWILTKEYDDGYQHEQMFVFTGKAKKAVTASIKELIDDTNPKKV